MDGLFTANFEDDADRNAVLLAEVSIAAAVYFWLHSRVFACGNSIRISITFLAKKLGVDRKSVSNAVKRLEDVGLISRESRPGDNGGTVFHLENVAFSPHPRGGSGTFECGGSYSEVGADPTRNKDKNPTTQQEKCFDDNSRIGAQDGTTWCSKTGTRDGFERFNGVF